MSDNLGVAAALDDVKKILGEPITPDTSSRKPATYKPFSGPAIWGVPYTDLDINYAVEKLYEHYYESANDPALAMERIINQNEKIVSRCGMLMGFSSIIIAISLYIATNHQMLPTIWQRVGFYTALSVWVISILRLLWSLKHKLPPPWEYGTSVDFKMTAKLFIIRMGLYNLLLIASVTCFVTMMALLMPISARPADLIFYNYPAGATAADQHKN
jgi:hypothetical protein